MPRKKRKFTEFPPEFETIFNRAIEKTAVGDELFIPLFPVTEDMTPKMIESKVTEAKGIQAQLHAFRTAIYEAVAAGEQPASYGETLRQLTVHSPIQANGYIGFYIRTDARYSKVLRMALENIE